MLRRTSLGEQEVVNFIIHKCKEAEVTNPYEAKAWLLTGSRLTSTANFLLQYEAYQLEKRLKNVDGTAYAFDQLFRKFGNHIEQDISEITNAVRIATLSKGKETPDQQFLNSVFQSLSKETQMEILIQCTEIAPVLFDKCQTMLLLVKLFPDTINQKNGEMLFTLLSSSGESDAFSTFRKMLVVELVPAVLQLSPNLTPSPRFVILLNQCIEYYVIVTAQQHSDALGDDRWEKLFQITDQIGGALQWSISPFFQSVSHSSSGTNSLESLYQALQLGFQHRNHYSTTELAYITVVVFLRCIVEYYELLRNSSTFGGKAKLVLVEVFSPRPHMNTSIDPNLPILASVSPSVSGNQSQIIQHLLISIKIWEMVSTLKGEHIEKEFFEILYSMKSLNLHNWDVFKEFQSDYSTYVGQYFQQNVGNMQSSLKIASMYCSLNNFKSAAEFCIKSVGEAVQKDGDFGNGSREDFSFYNPQVYDTDVKGNFIFQRRVHFLSDNRAEVLSYAANIMIRCFHESIDAAKDDRCIGHLLILLQLEWPSGPAELIFTDILETIKRNGSFRYFPFFSEFVIEPDFLETFMAMNSHQSKTVKLELFPAAASSSGRRIGTRGVEKGSKTEFRSSMKRQMTKNGRLNLESLIAKFLNENEIDILNCFDDY